MNTIDIAKLTIAEILDLKQQLRRVSIARPVISNGKTQSVMQERLEAAKTWDWNKPSFMVAAEHGVSYATARTYRRLLGIPLRSDYCHIDTSKLDWSKSNSQLSRETGASISSIKKLRHKYGVGAPTQTDHSHLPPMQPAQKHSEKLKQYENWDWKRPDIVIAREKGLTRERVRQIRVQLGKPKCLFHHFKYEAFLNTFKGQKEISEAEAKEKLGLSPQLLQKYCRMSGKTKTRAPFIYTSSYRLMNFDLPNIILKRCWKIEHSSSLANFRCKYAKPKAKFRSIKGSVPDQFKLLVVQEERKAAKYFKKIKQGTK